MAVIDTCLFLNENDVFNLRYDILHDVVDRFIVVESNTTLQGAYKGYVFLGSHLPKVEHVKIEYPIVGSGDTIAMENEWWSRDTITDYLRCDADDWVLLSDVDEIPDPIALQDVVQTIDKHSRARDFTSILAFEQYLSYYYANLRAKELWYGTKMAKRGTFNKVGDLRRVTKDSCIVVSHGGWHMSYLGTPEQRQYKLQNFGHADAVREAGKYIEHAAKSGVDYLGRSDMQLTWIEPDDPTLPAIIYEYPEFLRM
jgi:hypothetical protein